MPHATIQSIAQELNERAHNHAIGRLQKMRAEIKGLSRPGSNDLFTALTTKENWAFHHGGRSELQFNIGSEMIDGRAMFRHGVAFSFQLSQTLPSIDVLIPKVRLFNDFLQAEPDRYADMRMWHYFGHGEARKRSDDYPPSAIMPELVVPGPFVFLGKRQEFASVDAEEILSDFDRLLPLYLFVESNGVHESSQEEERRGFVFQAGCSVKASSTRATLAERELNIALKHNLLQDALCKKLIREHGSENVADEHASGMGTKIDVVLRRGADDFWYYEIKTAKSARACLREALGQILEYAYWPGAREASKLIICGESPLDKNGRAYLEALRRRFNLPIDYEDISLDT